MMSPQQRIASVIESLSRRGGALLERAYLPCTSRTRKSRFVVLQVPRALRGTGSPLVAFTHGAGRLVPRPVEVHLA